MKNEADIIEYSIGQHLRYIDRIYVFDNGSTDGTWEVIQRLAATHPGRIFPHVSDPCPFRDNLRSVIFNAYRQDARPGDWWCRLDADEIYVDDPREFLARVPAHHHVVWSIHLQYYPDRNMFDPALPLEQQPLVVASEATLPRHYVSDASEARFFRHRPRLVWEREDSWPQHMGLVHPERIRLKHFKYRSPHQIAMRLKVRTDAAKSGWAHFSHSVDGDWTSKLVDGSKYHFDSLDGNMTVDSHLLPNHLESRSVRIVKRILHSTGIWP